jgi:hypothetical protein
MQSAHTKLSTWWQAQGDHSLAAKPQEETVREIEQRYGVELPEDFRTYLLQSAPQDFFVDAQNMEWWAPGKIKNIPDEYEHPLRNSVIAARARFCLFFADFFIWAHAYAICCDRSEYRGKIAIIGGHDRFVSTNFTEFVDTYITDPASIEIASTRKSS